MTDYFINHTPKIVKRKTPFELFHGIALSYSQMKVFGCLALTHDHKLPKDKFREPS